MLIYKGNYSDWLKQEWLDYIISHDGYPGPGGKVPENTYEENGKKRLVKAGYDWASTLWHSYDQDNLPFDIKPPVDNIKQWWFVRQMPGQIMPMHGDHDDDEATRTIQYWMPTSDYESGHVLIYSDNLMNKYKRGDLYVFDDVQAIHGSCNIGFTPRITLNIVQDLS